MLRLFGNSRDWKISWLASSQTSLVLKYLTGSLVSDLVNYVSTSLFSSTWHSARLYYVLSQFVLYVDMG